MRTIITSFLFTLFCLPVFAQTEKQGDKIISAKFQSYYNSGQYDSIFNLFSSEMANHLPLEQTQSFLSELKEQAGYIEKREFQGYNSSYAIYKTRFEKANLLLQISLDNELNINGFLIKPFESENLPKMDRNRTKLILPFTGEWTVRWGGDTKEQNHHTDSKYQKFAFDFLITDKNNKSFKIDGTRNEDYYAFGQPIQSPCDGEIVLVVDGVKDNTPGDLNAIYIPGNTVILKTIKNEYLVFAHFKQQTIKVKQGDKVKQGKILGLCGNSGNSSEPHLHFHIQNTEDMNLASGVKCFFDNMMVNGMKKTDYSPVKGEKIQNPLQAVRKKEK